MTWTGVGTIVIMAPIGVVWDDFALVASVDAPFSFVIPTNVFVFKVED